MSSALPEATAPLYFTEPGKLSDGPFFICKLLSPGTAPQLGDELLVQPRFDAVSTKRTVQSPKIQPDNIAMPETCF